MDISMHGEDLFPNCMYVSPHMLGPSVRQQLCFYALTFTCLRSRRMIEVRAKLVSVHGAPLFLRSEPLTQDSPRGTPRATTNWLATRIHQAARASSRASPSLSQSPKRLIASTLNTTASPGPNITKGADPI